MKAATIAMIVASVALTSLAQIALKFGMTDRQIQQLIAAKDYVGLLWSVATSLPVIAGLALFASSVALWLAVLASVPLSIAYPFVALGICLTTAAGALIFQEPVSALKLAGIALIVGGIVCVSLSGSR